MLLVVGYWLLGGFGIAGGGFGIVWGMLYLSGAIIALWLGRRPVGELRPISLRPFYVLGGTLLMFWAVFMMLTTKDLNRKGRGKAPATKRVAP
jgi:hypothetical protein